MGRASATGKSGVAAVIQLPVLHGPSSAQVHCVHVRLQVLAASSSVCAPKDRRCRGAFGRSGVARPRFEDPAAALASHSSSRLSSTQFENVEPVGGEASEPRRQLESVVNSACAKRGWPHCLSRKKGQGLPVTPLLHLITRRPRRTRAQPTMDPYTMPAPDFSAQLMAAAALFPSSSSAAAPAPEAAPLDEPAPVGGPSSSSTLPLPPARSSRPPQLPPALPQPNPPPPPAPEPRITRAKTNPAVAQRSFKEGSSDDDDDRDDDPDASGEEDDDGDGEGKKSWAKATKTRWTPTEVSWVLSRATFQRACLSEALLGTGGAQLVRATGRARRALGGRPEGVANAQSRRDRLDLPDDLEPARAWRDSALGVFEDRQLISLLLPTGRGTRSPRAHQARADLDRDWRADAWPQGVWVHDALVQLHPRGWCLWRWRLVFRISLESEKRR